MPIAISEDHRALSDTVRDFLAKNRSVAVNRELLEAGSASRPPFWADLAALGWLGLHLPEEYGGSGFGLPELAVVVEQLGRGVCPGLFVPTVTGSATIAEAAPPDVKAALLPGLADGTRTAAVGLSPGLTVTGGRVNGRVAAVLGGPEADLLVLLAGPDVVIVERADRGVAVETMEECGPGPPVGPDPFQ